MPTQTPAEALADQVAASNRKPDPRVKRLMTARADARTAVAELTNAIQHEGDERNGAIEQAAERLEMALKGLSLCRPAVQS